MCVCDVHRLVSDILSDCGDATEVELTRCDGQCVCVCVCDVHRLVSEILRDCGDATEVELTQCDGQCVCVMYIDWCQTYCVTVVMPRR